MAERTERYVDTSALIAFLDRSDSHHPLFARLFAEPPPLLTSPLVIAEGHGWFLKRYDAQSPIFLPKKTGGCPWFRPINRWGAWAEACGAPPAWPPEGSYSGEARFHEARATALPRPRR